MIHREIPLNVIKGSKIREGLDFILKHFNDNRLFPRKIMTKTIGYQKEVFSAEEAIKYYVDSGLIDCRINAFPTYVDYKGIQRYPPDLIFIDLDRSDFKTEDELKSSVSRTLKMIEEKLRESKPTVLRTGNGYHIYQPIESPILEQLEIFSEFSNPSIQFLRFAKTFLSSNKADKSNNPSFKSCLLRIPFSYNSKSLNSSWVNHKEFDSEISILQEWNGHRPSIKYLLQDFWDHMIDKSIKDMKYQRTILRHKIDTKVTKFYNRDRIEWIEKLLQLSIMDYRKHSVILILSPYLVNVKRISYQESYDILSEWLSKCNQIRPLDFNPNCLINSSLNTAISKGIPPMKLDTLKNRNTELYDKMKSQN